MAAQDEGRFQERWSHWRNIEWLGALGRMRRELFSLLGDTWRSFREDDGGTRAAALGYYALFSLFPLTVMMALVLSVLVGDRMARIQVMLAASRYLPTDLRVVDDIVSNVLENRGTLSALAVVGILWSSVQIFRVLEQAINRAWGAPLRRGFWRNVAFSIGMIATAGLLTLLSLAVTGLFEIAQRAQISLPLIHISPLQNPVIWAIVAALPPLLLTTGLFMLLYRFVPHDIQVSWRDVLPGALAAALLWEGAKWLFTFYLSTFARQNYNLIYGSVGAILALLTWVYVTGYIVLLGAEFCAVLARHRRDERRPHPTGKLVRKKAEGNDDS